MAEQGDFREIPVTTLLRTNLSTRVFNASMVCECNASDIYIKCTSMKHLKQP